MDVLESAGRAIDQILRLAVAKDAAGDADFVPLDSQLLLALGKSHGDLGHIVRLARVGAIENDIGHLAATEGLCRLLTKHPPDGVKHVRFATTVRADNGCHPAMEPQGGLGGKGLESDQFE